MVWNKEVSIIKHNFSKLLILRSLYMLGNTSIDILPQYWKRLQHSSPTTLTRNISCETCISLNLVIKHVAPSFLLCHIPMSSHIFPLPQFSMPINSSRILFIFSENVLFYLIKNTLLHYESYYIWYK